MRRSAKSIAIAERKDRKPCEQPRGGENMSVREQLPAEVVLVAWDDPEFEPETIPVPTALEGDAKDVYSLLCVYTDEEVPLPPHQEMAQRAEMSPEGSWTPSQSYRSGVSLKPTPSWVEMASSSTLTPCYPRQSGGVCLSGQRIREIEQMFGSLQKSTVIPFPTYNAA
jgi:hypothetical protein